MGGLSVAAINENGRAFNANGLTQLSLTASKPEVRHEGSLRCSKEGPLIDPYGSGLKSILIFTVQPDGIDPFLSTLRPKRFVMCWQCLRSYLRGNLP